MNISSASSQNSIFGLANQANTPKKPLVGTVDPANANATQEKLLNKQANQNQSIVVDQQAIAQFEKSQLEVMALKSNVSDSQSSNTAQDKPSAKNETAVASYQTVGNLAQRESVQQLFGVDVFA